MKSEDLQFNEMACIAAGGDWHPENNPERCLTVEPAEKCCCCVEDIKLVKVETRDKTKPGQRRDGHYFEGKIHLEFHGDTIPGCNCVPHWLEEVKKGREPRYFRLARRFIRKYSNTTQGGQLIMVGNNLNVAALVRAAQEQIKTTKESKRTPDRLLSAIAKYNNSNSIGPLLNWSKQCRPGKRVVFPFSDTPAIAWAVARTMYIAVGMDSCGCPPACRCNNRYVLLELRQTLKPGVLALEEKKTMKNCKGKVSEGKWQQIKIKQDCNR